MNDDIWIHDPVVQILAGLITPWFLTVGSVVSLYVFYCVFMVIGGWRIITAAWWSLRNVCQIALVIDGIFMVGLVLSLVTEPNDDIGSLFPLGAVFSFVLLAVAQTKLISAWKKRHP